MKAVAAEIVKSHQSYLDISVSRQVSVSAAVSSGKLQEKSFSMFLEAFPQASAMLIRAISPNRSVDVSPANLGVVVVDILQAESIAAVSLTREVNYMLSSLSISVNRSVDVIATDSVDVVVS